MTDPNHTPPGCPAERFPTLTDADTALVARRARAALSGSPHTIPRRAYSCDTCGGAHLTRASHPRRGRGVKPGPLTGTPREPIHPALAAGFTTLCAGLLAWAWLDEWRWAATGLVLSLLSGVAAATRSTR